MEARWRDEDLAAINRIIRAEVAARAPRLEVDDLVQDTWLALLGHTSDSPIQARRAFVRTVAVRVCASWYRRCHHAIPTVTGLRAQLGDPAAARLTDTEDVDTLQRLIAHAHGLLPHLPTRQRGVLRLILTRNTTVHGIAAELGIDRSDVRRVVRALARRLGKPDRA